MPVVKFKKKNLKNQKKTIQLDLHGNNKHVQAALMFALPKRKFRDIYKLWQFSYTCHKMVCLIPPDLPGGEQYSSLPLVFHEPSP